MRIGIVAHQARIRQADRLLRAVEADTISVDRGYVGPQLNHVRTWKRLATITEPHEWAIVLEDDALPCNNFRKQADNALGVLESEAEIASLYIGRQRPIHWQDRIAQAVAKAGIEDASWIVGDAVLHGVAIAMRGNRIHDMLEFVTSRSEMRPIDEAITDYSRRNYIDCWYTWPSIIEHADMPTLIKHPDGEPREPGRVAWQFGTRPMWTGRRVNL